MPRSRKPAGDNVVPLRKDGPLKPLPQKGVHGAIGLDGFDLDEQGNLVIVEPDGTTRRFSIDDENGDG